MKIGIDYRFASTSVRGIGSYIREIVSELMAADPVNTYILYCQSDPGIPLPANFSIGLLPKMNILLFEQLSLPARAKKDRVNVLWYPSNSGPLFLHREICLLVTVHDLISFKSWGAFSYSPVALKNRAGELYRRFALTCGLKRIDTLTTVSKFTQGEIGRVLGRTAEVVSNHIRPDELPVDDGILSLLGVKSGDYVYSMTGESPHKNLAGLLALVRNAAVKKKVVISGIYNVELIAKLTSEFDGRVIFTGRITEAGKNSLYKHAAAFLFLPYHEGFGIPLLEAMHHHLPIIAANNSSLPEVLGKGGELVNPDDAVQIRQLLSALPWSMHTYIPAQNEQLAKFSSWRSAAFKMKELFTLTQSSPAR